MEACRVRRERIEVKSSNSLARAGAQNDEVALHGCDLANTQVYPQTGWSQRRRVPRFALECLQLVFQLRSRFDRQDWILAERWDEKRPNETLAFRSLSGQEFVFQK